MEKSIAKKLSNVASNARRKANYLRMRPSDPSCWNYEQKQGGPEALDEIAKEIETLVAAYFIFANLDNNKELLGVVSRQIRSTIQREKRRAEVLEEYAALR